MEGRGIRKNNKGNSREDEGTEKGPKKEWKRKSNKEEEKGVLMLTKIKEEG